MQQFWSISIKPILDAVRPARVLHIGPSDAPTVARLREYAEQQDVQVEAIDPARSLEVLPQIGAVDLALIDAGHDPHPVSDQLRLLDTGNAEGNVDPPVVLIHGVGSQHGEDLRGVRRAAEDFVWATSGRWQLTNIEGWDGLGVLVPQARLEANPALRELLDRFGGSEFLVALVRALERERALARIECERLERASQTRSEVAIDGSSDADVARREVAELREALELRQRQELITRIAELERELAAARVERDFAEAVQFSLERRLREHAHEAEELPPLALRRSISAGVPIPAQERTPAPEPAPPPPQPTLAPAPQSTPATERAPAPGPIQPPPPPAPEQFEVAWLPAELETRERFAEEYADSAALLPDGRDATALPAARDRRGVLLGRDDPHPDGRPRVDVIVCVHNALDDVRLCIWSLVEKTTYPFHLIVVDDGSDADTAAFLDEVALAQPSTTLIRNDHEPHGYTIAANLGMRAATGDYLILLNSDTIVTPRWIDRIVDCGESDERIGVLGPLSNAASHQSIPLLRSEGAWATNPLPSFATPDAISLLLERLSDRQRPRMPFINGFCYVIKRAVIDAIGYFDEERFATGYCEENDFSHRTALAGFELAVADDGYVYHAKSKSFTVEGRSRIAKHNYQLFLEKHGPDVINAKVNALENSESLTPLRAATQAALSGPDELASALELEDDDPLTVVFVLPGLGEGGSGGSHSVYQEVRGMRRLGIPARIALSVHAWPRAVEAYEDAGEIFETYSDLDQLADLTLDADVISATHFKSVELVAGLRHRRSNFLPAYYIQDYEPFFAFENMADIEEALRSYTLIDDCLLFAKTHWLCRIVADRHDRYVAKVEPSIDEELFIPCSTLEPHDRIRVAAMVRPRTPRRQPSATVAVLDALGRALGERVELTTFGCTNADLKTLGASSRLLAGNRGRQTRTQVAEMLGSTDVFVDLSMYQAFGRTALEAMACGATAIVPRLGGAWDFVEDRVNAVAVDTMKPREALDALVELCSAPERVAEMKLAARSTAERYSIPRAALSEYLVFQRELVRRKGRVDEADLTRATRSGHI